MLIIEGIDGVGKTTLSNQLESFGFKKYYFDYDEKSDNLVNKYNSVLYKNINDLDRLVFDRSFVSEMVYGPILRGVSRLSENEFKSLLINYNKYGCKIIHMVASTDTLLLRKKDDSMDIFVINRYYEQLNDRYGEVMEIASGYIETMVLDTDLIAIESMKYVIKEKYIK